MNLYLGEKIISLGKYAGVGIPKYHRPDTDAEHSASEQDPPCEDALRTQGFLKIPFSK